MNLAIVTLGTRGDLQPFLALGLGLKHAWFEILVISSKNEESFVKGFGLDYHALSVDIQKIMEAQEVQSMTKGDGVAEAVRLIRQHLAFPSA